MTRYAQIFLLCLTALIQLGAPLVHAHAPGGDDGSRLHMPGLEFLVRLGQEELRAPDAAPEPALVVDMQSGVLESLRSAQPSQPCKLYLDAVPCLIEPAAHQFHFAMAGAPSLFAPPASLSPPIRLSQARAPPR